MRVNELAIRLGATNPGHHRKIYRTIDFANLLSLTHKADL
jgi:hypothetical protein